MISIKRISENILLLRVRITRAVIPACRLAGMQVLSQVKTWAPAKSVPGRRLFIHALILLFTSSAGWSAVDLGFAKEDGGRPGAFLDFAASARSMAMGRAFVGVADDASAAYWNPAGLAQLQRKDFVATYASLFGNTGFGSINFAQPTVDMGTFGIGLVSLNTTGVPRRDLNGVEDGEFNASQMGLLLSNGYELGSALSVGSSLKVIRQQVDTYAATGYGLDGSAMFRLSPTIQIGAVVRNILAPKIKLRSESETYPLDIRLGTKWQVTHKLLMAVDADKTTGRSLKPLLGSEWQFNDLIALRLGLNESEITTGLGLRYKDWGLDYAFAYNDAVNGLSDLGASHRLGFHFGFGKKVSEQAASARWQKKGEQVWAQLKTCMNSNDCAPEEIQRLTSATKQVVRHQGFTRALDLYTAQGYVAYLNHEYERSVQAFSEALALSPQNAELTDLIQRARAEMTEASSRELINVELKRITESYSKGDWKTTVKACEKVLSFQPDNVEAATYLHDAKQRIEEPIEREMKIATLKFGRGEYLDAMKSLQRVKELDPDNIEASKMTNQAIAALEKQAADQFGVTGETSRPGSGTVRPNTEQSRDLYSKGLVLYSQGDIKAAAAMWEQAVRADTNNALARSAYNRAQIEMNEKP